MDIPGYKVERLVAKGGMAAVYLAVQKSLGRRVALKILQTNDKPEQTERFINEGRIIASLAHPNVITIHDIGAIGGYHYIAMEHLEGGDLEARIRSGLTPASAIALLKTLGECLAFVHGKGIVHRDIKPGNILFRNDDTPVITDFGIAKQLEQDTKLTRDGTAMGSPDYLSPEQAECKPLDGRTDIYGLGIVLYEMLTGRTPYHRDSYIETLMAHLTAPAPTLPTELACYQPLLERMIAKDPDARFESATQLVDYLGQLPSPTVAKPGSGRPPRQTPPTIAFSKRDIESASGSSAKATAKRGQQTRKGPVDQKIKPRRTASGEAGNRKRFNAVYAAVGTVAGLVTCAAGLALYVTTDDSKPERLRVTDEYVGDHKPKVNLDARDGAAERLAHKPKPTAASNRDAAVASRALKPSGPNKDGSSSEQPKTRAPVVATTSNEEAQKRRRQEELKRRLAEERKQRREEELKRRQAQEQKQRQEQQRKRRVNTLIAKAERSLKAYRLTTPAGNNAYYYYQEALKLDRKNTAVATGINEIATRYARLAKARIAKHEYEVARRFVAVGLSVKSNHQELRDLDRRFRNGEFEEPRWKKNIRRTTAEWGQGAKKKLSTFWDKITP